MNTTDTTSTSTTFQQADGSIIADIERIDVGDDAHEAVKVSRHLIGTL